MTAGQVPGPVQAQHKPAHRIVIHLAHGDRAVDDMEDVLAWGVALRMGAFYPFLSGGTTCARWPGGAG